MDAADVFARPSMQSITRSAGELEALGHRTHDPAVGLVVDEEVDVVEAQLGGFHRLPGDLHEPRHGHAKGLVTLHVHETGGTAHVDQVGRGAVGAEHHRTDAAGPVRGPGHHGTGSVPEQRRGAAVVGVDEARHQVRADHEHVPCPAGLDLPRSQRQRRRGSRCTRRPRRTLRPGTRRGHAPRAGRRSATGRPGSSVATTTRSRSAGSRSARGARRDRQPPRGPRSAPPAPPRAAPGCRCG